MIDEIAIVTVTKAIRTLKAICPFVCWTELGPSRKDVASYLVTARRLRHGVPRRQGVMGLPVGRHGLVSRRTWNKDHDVAKGLVLEQRS